MKYSLKIVKSMVGMCILLNASLLTYADSSRSDHDNINFGNDGCCNKKHGGCHKHKHCKIRRAYGDWFDGGSFTQTLTAGTDTTLQFVTQKIANDILNVDDNGTFLFLNSGVYKVTVGVVAANTETSNVFIFQLKLNGVLVPGAILEVQPRAPILYSSLNEVSTIIEVTEGSKLALKYINSFPVNGQSVTVGPAASDTANVAFITITQITHTCSFGDHDHDDKG